MAQTPQLSIQVPHLAQLDCEVVDNRNRHASNLRDESNIATTIACRLSVFSVHYHFLAKTTTVPLTAIKATCPLLFGVRFGAIRMDIESLRQLIGSNARRAWRTTLKRPLRCPLSVTSLNATLRDAIQSSGCLEISWGVFLTTLL